MSTNDIKNLSIALECVSRMQGYKAEGFKDRIVELLEKQIEIEEVFSKPPMMAPPQSPDNEIPF